MRQELPRLLPTWGHLGLGRTRGVILPDSQRTGGLPVCQVFPIQHAAIGCAGHGVQPRCGPPAVPWPVGSLLTPRGPGSTPTADFPAAKVCTPFNIRTCFPTFLLLALQSKAKQ